MDRILPTTLGCSRSVSVVSEPIQGVPYQGCSHAVTAPNFWLYVYICSFGVLKADDECGTATGEKLDSPCKTNPLV